MNLDVTKVLKQIDGAEIIDSVTGKGLTISNVISNALLVPEDKLSGEEQVKRFILATRIYDATLPVEISVEDAVLIKKCVAKAYAPLVTGQVWQAVDPTSPGK